MRYAAPGAGRAGRVRSDGEAAGRAGGAGGGRWARGRGGAGGKGGGVVVPAGDVEARQLLDSSLAHILGGGGGSFYGVVECMGGLCAYLGMTKGRVVIEGHVLSVS